MRFRINFGHHTIGTTTYTKGDLIQTDVDLAKQVPIYDVGKRLPKFTALPDDPTPPTFDEVKQ